MFESYNNCLSPPLVPNNRKIIFLITPKAKIVDRDYRCSREVYLSVRLALVLKSANSRNAVMLISICSPGIEGKLCFVIVAGMRNK